MSDVVQSDLFPLPLVPFEIYLLADDTPEYPMTFCLGFDFEGEFERAALETALEEALSRHPLFCARIERLPRKGVCWVAEPGHQTPFDWNTIDVPLECPNGGAIDLASETGMRLWVRQSGGRARLTVQVHHACSDGLGVLQFFGDLLAIYAGKVDGTPDTLKFTTLDPSGLHDRGRFDVELPEPISGWQIAKSSAVEAMKFLFAQPTPIAAPAVQAAAAQPFPGICSHTFDTEKTESLQFAAQLRGASVNDLLMRDAFVVMADWNTMQSPRAPGQRLRVNMPVNLRGRGHRQTPATNMMSYAFLTRSLDDCTNPSGLLDGIHEETALIKRWSLGLMFLDGLNFTTKVPGLLQFTTSRRRCLASMVVSNVGNPALHFRTKLRDKDRRVRAGGVVLRRVTGAPPVRPMTRAAMAVFRYAGQMTIGILCDPQHFSPADTQSLLDQYVARLEESAASA